jgi:tRNA threonylcarbamoyladenosine biosynthesis protein TsaB
MIDPEARFLLIETSGTPGWAAVATPGGVRAVAHLDQGRRHARDLAPSIAQLLHAQGWQPRQLSAVAVGVGPGSYTGLRVGVMTAKSMAYAVSCSLVAIPTFEAWARSAWLAMPGDSPIRTAGACLHVVEDGQQDWIYLQSFKLDALGEHALGSLKLIRLGKVAGEMASGTACIGPGARKVPKPDGGDMGAWPNQVTSLAPQAVLELAVQRLSRGETASPFDLEPIYLRPSQAEEQWTALGR